MNEFVFVMSETKLIVGKFEFMQLLLTTRLRVKSVSVKKKFECACRNNQKTVKTKAEFNR